MSRIKVDMGIDRIVPSDADSPAWERSRNAPIFCILTVRDAAVRDAAVRDAAVLDMLP